MPNKRSSRKKSRPVGRPSQRRGPDTEKQILDAAEMVFAQVGFEGARTQEIADVAGVTKAMIHYYFSSKERLYHAVLDRFLFELIKLVQDVSTQDTNHIQYLDSFVRGFFDYLTRHPEFGRLTFIGRSSHGRYFEKLVANFLQPIFLRGVQFIEEGIAEGSFRQVDARQFILSIYALVSSYFTESQIISLFIEDDALAAENLARYRETVCDIVYSTLGVKAPDARPVNASADPPAKPEDQ